MLREISWDEDLFIDGVDYEFCVRARRAGWRVFEHRAPAMDHQLGRRVETSWGPSSYEGGTRPYYIFRNFTYLLIRRQAPPWEVLRLFIGVTRTRLAVDGASSLPHLARLVVPGIGDGLFGRLGPRDEQLRRPDGVAR